MATVPLSGTHIRIMKGVPFSNDYKHTRWFDTYEQQLNYFLGKPEVHTISSANFQRIEGKFFIAVNKSIDELWSANYLMFVNNQVPNIGNKWFYAFITKLEYVQRSTTYVHFEIDVFQTWKFDMNFKPSYVVREHCKLWNADGSPVINTIDEGLDYGTDYDTVGARFYTPFDSVLFLVIVSKSTLHVVPGYPSAGYIKPSMNGGAQPLSVYIHPFNFFGSSPQVKIDGVTYNLSSLNTVLNAIYAQDDAVNNIASLYITDHVGIDFTYEDGVLEANTGVFQDIKVINISGGGDEYTIYVDESNTYNPTAIECNPKYEDFGGTLNNDRWDFSGVDETKLLMYPYAFTVIDDFKGNRITLKNEYISGNRIEVDVMGSMGVSNKVAYVPKNYLTEKLSSEYDKQRVGIENALVDQSPRDVPILTDMLSAFLQGNRNSLQNQAFQTAFNGNMSIADGLLSGIASAMRGNVAGAVGSGLNIVKGAQNAVYQLQTIQAKIKDINNVPPSISKLGSNTSFQYGNGYYGFWVISKQIKPEYRKKLSDFFKMYGYKVNEVKMPNFHTRQNWNYVQTISCNITGNFNHEDLQELKNVFDNGITFWHTDDIGNYALPNGVIS